MASYLENLRTIRDNLVEELVDETTRRLALTAAGNPPPTTYSVDGQNVDWNGYLKTMHEKIAAINTLLQNEELYEIIEHGY